jgi:glycosyltransferase involved in cell wall biosynthesis
LGDLEFETFFYNSIYSWKEREISFRDMALAIRYSFLWKRRYRHNLKPDDLLLVASKSSEKTIAQLGLQASYLPYPWPVTGKAVGPIERPSKPTFLFFGSLVGLGSRSAFHTMIKDIYPGLVRTWGGQGFDILIGGRGQLPSWVENDITAKPEIRYIGFIEDLDAVIGTCHAVLIPIDVPVGNRSRILTALSKRAVVVAHRNTALGNPDLVDGESCYIAETGDEFVDRLRRTFEKPEEAREIAERGYNVYNTHFEPSKAVSSFIKLIQSQLPLATGRNEAHPL